MSLREKGRVIALFEGFGRDAFDFLMEIRFNNSREWFDARRKEHYRDVIQRPMRELGESLYARISQLRPNDGLALKVSRVYRDARRVRSGGPLQDHIWLSIRVPVPGDDWEERPSFWFSLDPESWGYGLSFPASPTVMGKLRSRMDNFPRRYLDLLEMIDKQREFRFQAQIYKRPKGQPRDARLYSWYNSRHFWVEHEGDAGEEIVFTGELLPRVREGMEFLLPLYDELRTIHADGDIPAAK